MNLERAEIFSFKKELSALTADILEWLYKREGKKLTWLDQGNFNQLIVQDYHNLNYVAINWWATKALLYKGKFLSSLYKKSDKLYTFDKKQWRKKILFNLELLEGDIWIIRKL